MATSRDALFGVSLNHELLKMPRDEPGGVPSKIAFDQSAKSVAILEGDPKIFVLSMNGYLYVKDLGEVDAASEWECLTPSRLCSLTSITFADGMAYALFNTHKRSIWTLPVSTLLSGDFKMSKLPDRYWKLHTRGPSNKLRSLAADSTHLYAIRDDRRICRIENLNMAETEPSWQVVSPDQSNFVSIALEPECGVPVPPDPWDPVADPGDISGSDEEEVQPEVVYLVGHLSGQTLLDLTSHAPTEVDPVELMQASDDELPARSPSGLFQACADRADHWKLGLQGLIRFRSLSDLDPSCAPSSPDPETAPSANRASASDPAPCANASASSSVAANACGLEWHIVLCLGAGALLPPVFLLVLELLLGQADPALTALPLLASTSPNHMLFHHKVLCLMGWVLQALVMLRPCGSFALILAMLFSAIIAASKVSRDPFQAAFALQPDCLL